MRLTEEDPDSEYTAEVRGRADHFYSGRDRLDGQGPGAIVARHEAVDKKLKEANKTVCLYARGQRIDTDSLKLLVEREKFEWYDTAHLVLSHVEDALAAKESSPPILEEWLRASKAIERAANLGYTLTAPELSKSKQKTRQRDKIFPGNHKTEVEWNSLIGYLTRKRINKDESLEETAEEAKEQTLYQKTMELRKNVKL